MTTAAELIEFLETLPSCTEIKCETLSSFGDLSFLPVDLSKCDVMEYGIGGSPGWVKLNGQD